MSVLEKVKALENGNGLQFLLDSAYFLFNNPVYIVDAYYNLIAASEGPEELSFWNELLTTGTFSPEHMEILARDGIFDTVAKLKKSIYIKKSGSRIYDVMMGPVFSREKDLICLSVMYEYYSDFDAESMAAYEALMDKIIYEIQDYEYFIRLPTIFFDDTVTKLLDRTVKNTIIHHSQARIIRHHFEEYLYVAVVNIPHYDMIESVRRDRLEYFRSLMNINYKSFRSAIYTDKLVMLMSSNHGDFNKALPLGRDYDLFEQNGLSVGISRSFENIYEFGKHYDQALSALTKGLENKNGKRVFIYGDTL